MPRHPYMPYLYKFSGKVSKSTANVIPTKNSFYDAKRHTHNVEYDKDYHKSRFDYRYNTGFSRLS